MYMCYDVLLHTILPYTTIHGAKSIIAEHAILSYNPHLWLIKTPPWGPRTCVFDVLRPVRPLRVSISEGLTQASS